MPIQSNGSQDERTTAVLIDVSPKNIGWNIQAKTESTKERKPSVTPPPRPPPTYRGEVQVSHKQITDRFKELLSLFEDYSKIMRESEQTQPKLKRTQSEQFTATHLQPTECEYIADTDSSELVKATVSLNRMQLSDSTLIAMPRKRTCDCASQTYWPVLTAKDRDTMLQKPKKSQQLEPLLSQAHAQPHTLHIEVESVTSITALERAPLRKRLWQVLTNVGHTLIACFSMMGENITYVLFVLLCLWCLYLIIAHYYTFLGGNPSQQSEVKLAIARLRAH